MNTSENTTSLTAASTQEFTEVKIESVEIYKYDLPLHQPFVISLGPIHSSENILVRITTNTGLIGYGECSPYVYIVGETQETCFAVAREMARLIKGKNPLHLEQVLATLDLAFAGNNTIKSAFDMALHDLVGQLTGLPLYALLGGNKEKKIFTDQTVGLNTPENMAEKAAEISRSGINHLKVKLGTDKRSDVARIAAIRAAIGGEINIRIDANQGWDCVTAIQTLRELDKYGILYCEEPVPKWNLNDLAKVRQSSPIPIMADESLFDPHDAIKLVRANAVDYFNIKLSKSGGIRNAIKINHIAESAGVKCQLGAMGESRLAMTACAHLALASDNLTWFDLDPPLMQSEDPVIGGIKYGAHGEVIIPDLPGIGASLDAHYLKSFEHAII